jgi:uncharacterized protein YdcH (DUF465 family)
MLKNKNADFQKIIDTYQGLDSSLKTSAKGNEILAQIESVKIILEAQK